MNCNQAQPELLDYSQGLLNPRQAEAIQAHLAGCAECRAVLEEETRLVKRLSALPQTEPKREVWSTVQSRLAPARRSGGAFDLIFGTPVRKLTAAAAAFVIILAALFSVAMWRIGVSEQESIAQAKDLMRVQPIAQQASTWTDDPLAGTTDAMLKVLEDETRPE